MILFESAFNNSYNSNSASSNGGSPTHSDSSSSDADAQLTPTQLLALAIRKRRSLIEDKERDFRRELLHTAVIQNLCKHLGENRAKARRRQRRPRRRPQKRRWSETSEADGFNGDQEVPESLLGSIPPPPPPPPNPLEQPFGSDSAVQSPKPGGGPQQPKHWTGLEQLEMNQHGNGTGPAMEALLVEDGPDNSGGGQTKAKRARPMLTGAEMEEMEAAGFVLCNLERYGTSGTGLLLGIFLF